MQARIELLGHFAARGAHGDPVQLSLKKARVALAVLAMSPTCQVGREELTALLWSDRSEAQAQQSVRQTLASIRRSFRDVGLEVLNSDLNVVSLNKDLLWIDAHNFEALVAGDDLQLISEGLALYRGPLLEGLSVNDPEAQNWLVSRRAELQAKAIRAFEKLLVAHRKAERFEALEPLALRALSLDPLFEEGNRALIAAYMRRGQRALAVRQFRQLRDLLARELQVSPAEETAALMNSVEKARPLKRGNSNQPNPPDGGMGETPGQPILIGEDPDAKSDESSRRLAISVLDGLSISAAGGEELPLRSQKLRGVVGYFALSGGARSSQDRLAALLWPDRSLAAARRALVGCCKALEKALGPDFAGVLVRRGSTVKFDSSQIDVDLLGNLEELNQGRVSELFLERSDWPEAILSGLEPASPLFASWLRVARHYQRSKVSEALESLLGRLGASDPEVRRAGTALLLLEPSHERAAQHLIRHYAATGNRPAAIRVYESLRQVMHERFQIEPSDTTNDLIRSLSYTTPLEQQGSSRKGRAPRISVGLFRAHADRLAHSVSGFRVDLIANLSKFRELVVLETQDSLAHGDTNYLVTGETIAAGQHLQLSVMLQQPGTGRIVWSETFVFALNNWIDTQRRLVGQIASSLEIYLSQDRLTATIHRPSDDLDVYDAWLRGEHLLAHWTPRADAKAATLFEYAISVDRNFVPAYASLASIYNAQHLVRPGSVLDEELARRAFELAQHAVNTDPLDARNHLAIAWSTALVGRYEQSELHYEMAAELNPNSPKTLVSVALGLSFMGRTAAATALLDRASALTSTFLDYHWSHMAVVHYLAGNFEESINAADKSMNTILDTPGWKAAALLQLGRVAEAEEALEELFAVISKVWEGQGALTRLRLVEWFLSAFPIKQQEDRRRLGQLRSLVRNKGRGRASHGSLALVEGGLGSLNNHTML